MINLKIDTKEKFNEIKVLQQQLTANMTGQLQQVLSAYLEKPVKNVILLLTDVIQLDTSVAETLVSIQQSFYEQDASFVICDVSPSIKELFDKEQLLESLNLAPTLSEAWDILQMEEIERELFD